MYNFIRIYRPMTIAFIHPHQSFLQNIEAYADFFSSYGISTGIYYPRDDRQISADIAWHFMGSDTHANKNTVTIHEYASTSVPPFSNWKNRVKKWINVTPDYRIFNSQFVKDAFYFKDDVPSGIREYGILPPEPEVLSQAEKIYDFVYVGTVGKERKLQSLFDCFSSGVLKDRSLLVLSNHYTGLARTLQSCRNIHFRGPVSYREVRGWIQQCRYGLNFMPDIFPFNQQISAKLLDYAAAGIPIVSTDYTWVRNFQAKYGGNFYYLREDLSNFCWEAITRYHYATPNLEDWTWEKQIRKSGVLEFLYSRLGVEFGLRAGF